MDELGEYRHQWVRLGFVELDLGADQYSALSHSVTPLPRPSCLVLERFCEWCHWCSRVVPQRVRSSSRDENDVSGIEPQGLPLCDCEPARPLLHDVYRGTDLATYAKPKRREHLGPIQNRVAECRYLENVR